VAFATEAKDELAHLDVARACCRRAELSAIVKVDGTLHLRDGEYSLEVSTASAAVARLTVDSFHRLYGLLTQVVARRSVLKGTNNYLVVVEPQPKLAGALNDLGIVDAEARLIYGIPARTVRGKCDAIAFLRGAFLAGGFVAHPSANAHLEVTTPTDELARDLARLLGRLGLDGKLTKRRNLYAVYLKGNEHVAQFLATVGAYRAVLAVEDGAVLKEVRAGVNRLVNCDTANVSKAVAAAQAQVSAIESLRGSGRLDRLPSALVEVALARLEYPEATLTELGEVMEPRLSKSAVYHRLRRLEYLAKENGSVPGARGARPRTRGSTARVR
jgi:cell division protein WhiA